MKSIIRNTALGLLALTHATSLRAAEPVKPLSQGISFQENKGQVHDQFHKARPDVLFSSSSKGLVCHLKSDGLSYQLNRVDKWREEKNKSSVYRIAEKSTIYRVDLTWKEANTNFRIEKGEAINGESNFYLTSCPSGVFNVKSFKDVTYKNLYNNIDLKWYSKADELEYDFIVQPGGNPDLIKMEFAGAETLVVNASGELVIKTPLGNITEKAPHVYQDGKSVPSAWKINGTTISFEIGTYDKTKKLIIDPVVTRVWGTYFGAAGGFADFGTGVASDNLGNSYLAGYTNATTNVATAGAHQTLMGGGANDGFLAKFDNNGVRVWGTYYGGAGDDFVYACAIAGTNAIFMSGRTTSTNNISTAGSHQAAFAGGGNDAFLVKFDANGVRQWGTYYGGATGQEYGLNCEADAAGNSYLVGYTSSTVGLGTAGAHQMAFGGGVTDAFVVKFNTSGVRQWSSNYGGTGDDYGNGCSVDASGNVYLVGTTSSTVGTSIASGGHQTTFGGGANDAYVVKFNASGVRQWGTYYGGTSGESGNDCAFETTGIYAVGTTTSTAAIATAGAHQTTKAGGNDAFLVKLDPSTGARLWGTYYGGSGGFGNTGNVCSVDAGANVIIGGVTTSSISAAMSTPFSFQENASGLNDAFIAKFNTSGVRQWASYCATPGAETTEGLSVSGNYIYLAGSTNNNGLGTTGTHLPTYGSGGDAYLVRFYDCNVTPTTSASSTICRGSSASIGGSGSGITSYSWSTGATTASISVSPTVTTSYTLTMLTATAQCTFPDVITVTVNATPTLAVSGPTAICSGTTVVLTASGASTYSWSTGATTNSISVSPTITTTYSVIGTNTLACSTTTVKIITVNTTPTVTAVSSSTSVCVGSSATLTASGATTYSWNTSATTASIVVSPTVLTTYSVTGTTGGCSNTRTISVSTQPTPTVNLTTMTSSLCTGMSTVLTATGAATYSWSTGATTSTISVSPTVTTTYSVTGYFGSCGNTKTITIINNTPSMSVSATSTTICTGGTATLTAGGATTYSWSTGASTPSIVVSPTASITYTVRGTNSGCSLTQSITVNVSTAINMNITASNPVSCSGAPVLLTASGASTYTWSTGPNTTSISVTPVVATNYTVSGTSGSCNGSTVITVGVAANPTVNSITSSSLICTLPTQQTATLTASGATTYSWNTGANSSAITVSPNITTTYTVIGTDANGCSNTSIVTQSVSTCAGVNELEIANEVVIFPNPSTGGFTIKGAEGRFEIINSIGQTIYISELNSKEEEVKIASLSQGIYYLKLKDSKVFKKIVVVQ